MTQSRILKIRIICMKTRDGVDVKYGKVIGLFKFKCNSNRTKIFKDVIVIAID